MNCGPEARGKGHFTHQAQTWGQPVPQQGLLSVTGQPFPGTHSTRRGTKCFTCIISICLHDNPLTWVFLSFFDRRGSWQGETQSHPASSQ